MKLFKTKGGWVVEREGAYFPLAEKSFDALVAHADLYGYLSALAGQGTPLARWNEADLAAPIENQPVWAAGVTYWRSRSARMSESRDAGGGGFYDRVYAAERPELFFKALPSKVVGPRQAVRIRRDAAWSVPEPELTLLVNPRAEIIGYTVGNDMSSRDIEGENPLYLPQAKVYDGSCALGPGIVIRKEALPATTQIEMKILRAGETAFSGSIALSAMKRDPASLADYLFREQAFPCGCFLLTGTGIVPPDSFTLQPGDDIQIGIGGIGTLVNAVA
jgi:2-dehydro-3-deoxy-D-arabinonate dehydratase